MDENSSSASAGSKKASSSSNSSNLASRQSESSCTSHPQEQQSLRLESGSGAADQWSRYCYYYALSLARVVLDVSDVFFPAWRPASCVCYFAIQRQQQTERRRDRENDHAGRRVIRAFRDGLLSDDCCRAALIGRCHGFGGGPPLQPARQSSLVLLFGWPPVPPPPPRCYFSAAAAAAAAALMLQDTASTTQRKQTYSSNNNSIAIRFTHN